MASVHYFEYGCSICGEFLFHNSNINGTSHCGNRYYVFVEQTPDVFFKIFIEGANIVKCETCGSCLGGMCYRWFQNEPNLIRFAGHLIERRQVDLVIYRSPNADGQCELIPKLHFGPFRILHQLH